MQIKAKTTYDLKAYQALIRMSIFKKRNPKLWMIIYSVLAVLLIGALIAEIILLDVSAVGYVALALLVLYMILLCMYYFIAPRLRYKATAKMGDIQNSFVFTENTLYAYSTANSTSSTLEQDYSAMYKVMETGEYFFIYRDKYSIYIIDKSTVTDGTPEDIRRILSGVAGLKYIICNY